MSRYTPRQSAEFESRQMAFGFAAGARFVVKTALDVKKALTNYVKRLFSFVVAVKVPHQLVLPLDAIAQTPLFGACTA